MTRQAEARGHAYIAPHPYRCASCGMASASIDDWSRIIIRPAAHPTQHYLLCPECAAQLQDSLD